VEFASPSHECTVTQSELTDLGDGMAVDLYIKQEHLVDALGYPRYDGQHDEKHR
jgi:hypothetical protein